MALPKQVQDALDAAEATLAEANGTQPTSTLEQLAAQTPGEPVAPVAPAEDQPAPQPPPPTRDPEETWEARFRSLKGLFDQKVPELQREVKSLQTDLSVAIDRLNKASDVKEQTPQRAEPLVDPKDVDAFGSDLVDMVNRVANAVVQQASGVLMSKATALEAQVAKLVQQMDGATQTAAVTAEELFFDKMAKLVPEWEAINSDAKFLAWLAEIDPIYGLPRQNALDHARQTLNAERAAAVFRGFTGPRQVQAEKVDPLSKQVSPKGAASETPTGSTPVVIKEADVVKFYDDVRRGAYRGREAEAARIEQVINIALQEGRIT